ncbi:MAG TPA: hypothetical protein ENH91_09735 [Leeuwenhoekiella sp.]|nr:hypothetical protein [Leeuwenhoekiella sp.]
MFLDVWREKRIKRNLEEAIKSYSGANPPSGIKRVGLLVDATAAIDVEALSSQINELQQRWNVTTLCYVRSVNKNEFHATSTFDKTAINWYGELSNAEVDFFLSQHYDLLVNYYTKARTILQYVTAKASADFKVGFPVLEKYHLNDLTIDTKPENMGVFCTELKNYLKILKRID